MAQQSNPQDLNFNRVTLAGCARRVIGVHPGEMARTPDQRGGRIHANPIGRTLAIMRRDAAQHARNRAVMPVHHRRIKLAPGRDGLPRIPDFRPAPRAGRWRVHGCRLFANDPEPQRRIRGVAIRRVRAVNGVGQRPFLLEAGERDENLFHLLHHSSRQQPARANQRVPSPIQKPRITRDDRFARVAPDDKCPGRLEQPGTEGVIPGGVVGQPWTRNAKHGIGNFILRRDDQCQWRCFGQRQIKPTRTVRVAAGDLSAIGLHGMRDAFTPFRLRMKRARVGEDPESAVRRRRERKTRPVGQRPCVRGEMVFRGAIAFGFPVKVAVFDIHTRAEPNVGGRGVCLKDFPSV